MNQGHGAQVGRSHPPTDSHLTDPNGFFILENLRRRVRAFLTSRVAIDKFVENVFSLDRRAFDAYMDPENSEEEAQRNKIYKNYHFQIFDWLMLADRNSVLNGKPPMQEEYFQKPYKGDGERVFAEEVRNDAVQLKEGERFNVPAMARRLDYVLQVNNWTRSQFALHVLDAENGSKVSKMITDPENKCHVQFHSAIFDFLQKSDVERRQIMEGGFTRTFIRRHVIYGNEIRGRTPEQILLDYIAKPKQYSISDAEFRNTMKDLAEKHFNKVKQMLDSGEFEGEKLKVLESMKASAEQLVLALNNGSELDGNHQATIVDIALMRGPFILPMDAAICIKRMIPQLRYKEFAEKVLKCTNGAFQQFMGFPSDGWKNMKGETLAVAIRNYLKLTDREEPWKHVLTDEEFRVLVHLEFVEYADNYEIREKEFRSRIMKIANQQMGILQQESFQGVEVPGLDPIRVKEDTQALLNFLNKRGRDTWRIRQRIISLAFMNGSKFNIDQMAECTRHVLLFPRRLGHIAGNVLQPIIGDIQSFLDAPVEYMQNLGQDQIGKTYDFLMMNPADRLAALKRGDVKPN